jgi:hypothetical protein
MTKTIGWILLAIANFVFTIISVLSAVDAYKRDVFPWVSGGFAIFFFVWMLIWIWNARVEWKEYQEWLKDE